MFEIEELKLILDAVHGELETNYSHEDDIDSVELHELTPEYFDLPEKHVVIRQTILKKIIRKVWPGMEIKNASS